MKMIKNYEYLGTPSGILKLLEILKIENDISFSVKSLSSEEIDLIDAWRVTFIQLFVVVAFAVFRGVFDGKGVDFAGPDANYLGSGILVACLIITPLLLICYLMGKTEIQGSILEVALNSLFFLLLFSVSLRSFVYWNEVTSPLEERSMGVTLGILTFLASLAYMTDIIFSAKLLKEFYFGE